jgi:pyrroline-5-carboxylate reductase
MRIAFIGGGAMGEAMVSAILKHGEAQPGQLVVSDVSELRRELLSSTYGVSVTEENSAAVDGARLVVMAVKPQEFSNVASGLQGKLTAGQTVLSIMAGMPIARIARELDHGEIVRAMPNTAAFVGEAMSVWTASAAVSEQGLSAAARVLGAMGRELQVHDEKYLDMTTAVSGSGPGYVFLFLEAFIDAAVAIGFRPETAEELMVQTLLGSALLARETGKPAAELRAMVTSRGGTTEAGLQVLEDAGLRTAAVAAVAAAYKRAKELGG